MDAKQNDPAQLEMDARASAIDVLSWLAGEPDMMARFLALTGLTADTLRQSAVSPGFYVALLDFLMNHEPTLIAYCEATGTPPETVVNAHQVLSGSPRLDTNAF